MKLSQTPSEDLQVGQYIYYKGYFYIVVELRDEKVLILNPSQRTIQVNASNCRPTDAYARKVTYKGKPYLVTEKGLIISLTTNKVMKWPLTNGDRIGVLDKAGWESLCFS